MCIRDRVILVSSSTSNTGVSTSLKAVQTGDGTNSALKIATNAIQISGVLEASGSVSLGSNLRVSDKVCASSFYGDGSNLTGVTATIAGNISVSNATIGSNLYVGGTVTVAGATHLQAAVSVGGAATFGSTVSVSGAAHLKSTVSVGGAATFASTVTVVGAALLKNNVSIGGTLAVAGAPTFTSKATFSNDVSVSGRLDVATSACIGGTFRAVGAATFDGDVSVSGGLVVGGTVTILGTNVQAASARVCASAYHGDGSNLTGITGGNISGNVSVSNLNVYNSVSIGGNLTASGTAIKFVNAAVCASSYYGDASNLTGITASIISSGRIDGSLAVSAALTVGAGVNIGGTLTVAGATSLASTLSVGGAANFASTVTVVGATHLKSTVTVGGAANFASTVTVVGATHLQSTASIGGAATFASTVTVVGAATYKSNVSVSGNMDVAGNVSIGGTLFAAGGITYDGDVSVSGNLAVGGNVSVGGTLSVTGAVSLASTLSVGGASNFLSTVTVAGNTRLGAVVSVVGAANFASTVTVVGATHLQSTASVGGAATFASTVTVVGATHLQSTASIGGAATFASTVTVVGATHLQAAVSVGGAATFASTVDVTGVATAATFEPDGDTSAGDNAAIGYTAAEGLILTGQGSTSDITLKNDADATVFTVPTGTDDILFPDAARAMFGAGSDLKIWHDGTHSHIDNDGAGALFIASDSTYITNGARTENYMVGAADGAVTLYHDASAKIATASTGVTITGEATATGFTGTLDGILGSGAAAAATVTTLTTSGIASIDDTTDSTSGTTGSIHTDGGVGIAKDLFVGVDAAIVGHAAIGANAVAADCALTLVGASDGTGSNILEAQNSSQAIKFSVRDDGFTTVGAALTVLGDIAVQDAAGPTVKNEAATATNPTLRPNNADPDTGIGWVSANKLSLIAGGTGTATVTGSGLGIGTAAPAYMLDISHASTRPTLRLHNTDTSGATYEMLFYTDSTANANVRNWGMFGNVTNFGDMIWKVSDARGGDPRGGNSVLSMTYDSKVGIGVAAPSHSLQVAAGADTDAMYLDVNGNLFITDGNVQITNPSGAAQAALHVTQDHASDNGARIRADHASFTGNVLQPWTVIAAGTGFDLIECVTSNGSAVPFRVRGDGQVTSSGGAAFAGTVTVGSEGTAATTNVSLGLCKAWVRTSGAAVTVVDSFNMTSVTDSGVGLYAPVIANNMNDANYALILGADDKQDGGGVFVHAAQDAVDQATTGYGTSFKKQTATAMALADANQNAASSVLGDLA
jgi:UDP-3-O-[3-hydroxymyristoyl] glucosamine N-acyltransferase